MPFIVDCLSHASRNVAPRRTVYPCMKACNQLESLPPFRRPLPAVSWRERHRPNIQGDASPGHAHPRHLAGPFTMLKRPFFAFKLFTIPCPVPRRCGVDICPVSVLIRTVFVSILLVFTVVYGDVVVYHYLVL